MNRSDQSPDDTPRLAAPGCPVGAEHDQEIAEIDLLSPLTIRGVTFRNRIGMDVPLRGETAQPLPDRQIAKFLRAIG